jgi:phospholipase C
VSSAYDLSVHGPNGFFRGFSGGSTGTRLDVRASYDERNSKIVLDIKNNGSERTTVTVRDG